jgi:hypothetical protein
MLEADRSDCTVGMVTLLCPPYPVPYTPAPRAHCLPVLQVLEGYQERLLNEAHIHMETSKRHPGCGKMFSVDGNAKAYRRRCSAFNPHYDKLEVCA